MAFTAGMEIWSSGHDTHNRFEVSFVFFSEEYVAKVVGWLREPASGNEINV
jgi:hypothetical protein